MALHINLYHEIQKQELARRRDPLKLGMLGLLLVVIGFVAFYFYRMESVHLLNVRIATLETEWKKFEPKQKAAKTREDELTQNIKLSDLLTKRIESRFYWAPILDEVLQNVPREVQITKLAGDLAIEKGRPSVLLVSGISSSAAPRKVAEDLRTALDEKLAENFEKVNSRFNSLDDTEESVTLDGKPCPTATFAIEFQLHNSAPEPTPVPARKKVAAQ